MRYLNFRSPSRRIREKVKKKGNFKVTTHCSHCKSTFVNCLCTRTQHVYDDVKKECRLCGEKFEPNGTGPQNKWYTFLIRIFPFNRWVDDISDKHDISYFEGYTETHKKIGDQSMLEATTAKVRKTWYLWPTGVWVKRAELNYVAVRDGGDESFNWTGCVSDRNIRK